MAAVMTKVSVKPTFDPKESASSLSPFAPLRKRLWPLKIVGLPISFDKDDDLGVTFRQRRFYWPAVYFLLIVSAFTPVVMFNTTSSFAEGELSTGEVVRLLYERAGYSDWDKYSSTIVIISSVAVPLVFMFCYRGEAIEISDFAVQFHADMNGLITEGNLPKAKLICAK